MVCSFARRPANYGLFDLRIFAQAKMQAPLVLRGEAAASGNFLHLLLAVPEQRDLGADRAAVAGGPFQLKFDPLIFRRHGVLVDQQRALLIGDHDIEHAAVPQIGKRDRAAVISVADSDRLGHIDKLAGAIVQPNRLCLIARQAAAFNRRPVPGIGDDGAVAAGHLGKVVPVAPVAVERDVAVDQIEIERAVVVQIAKLRAKTPAAEFDSEIARQILVLDGIARRSLLGHPQIVSLDQDAVFRNVGNVDRISALVEDVAEGGVHSALGGEAHAGLLAHFMETACRR